MAFSLPTSLNTVESFAGALYGYAVGQATMSSVNADITANGLTKTLNNYYSASFGAAKTADVAKSIVSNLGLGTDVNAITYVTAQLNSATADTRGAAVVNILNLFAGLTSDATYGTAATAWSNTVANLVTYGQTQGTDSTVTAAAATVTAIANAPKSYVLTTSSNPQTGGADNLTGTAGNDSFTGTVDLAGTATSFNAGDIINGNGGSDTLNVTLIGTTANVTAYSGVVSNVQTYNVNNTANVNTTIDLGGISKDLATFNLTGSQDGFTLTTQNFNNIPTIGLAGQGGFTFAAVSSVTAGTADKLNVNLNGTSDGVGTTKTNVLTSENIETVALNAVKDSTIRMVDASLITLNVTGAAKATVYTPSTNTVLKTIDASAATGNVTIYDNGTGTTTQTIKTGSGDDTINLNGIDLTSTVTVNGGAGNNTLSVRNTTFASNAFANVSNIQNISLSGNNTALTAVSLDLNSTTITGSVQVQPQLPATNLANLTTISATGTTGNGAAGSFAAVADPGALSDTNASTYGTNLQAVTNAAGSSAISNAAAAAYAKFKTSGIGAGGLTTNNPSSTTYETLELAAAKKEQAYAQHGAAITVNNITTGGSISINSSDIGQILSTDTSNVSLIGEGVVTASVKNANLPTSTNDTLTVTVNNNSTATLKNTNSTASTASAGNNFSVDQLTVSTGVETVTINSTGSFGSNSILALSLGSATTVNVTGNNNITLGAYDSDKPANATDTITGQALGWTYSGTDTVTLDGSTLAAANSSSYVMQAPTAANFVFKGNGNAKTSLTLVDNAATAMAPITSGIPTINVVFGPLATGSFDFTNAIGHTTDTVTFYAGAQKGVVTINGIANGGILNLKGTLEVNNTAMSSTIAAMDTAAAAASPVTINGGGTSASETIKFTDNSSTYQFVANKFTLGKVGTVTFDVTRSASSTGAPVYGSTEFANLATDTVKTLTVTGAGTTTIQNGTVDLGVISGTASASTSSALLSKIDLTGYNGNQVKIAGVYATKPVEIDLGSLQGSKALYDITVGSWSAGGTLTQYDKGGATFVLGSTTIDNGNVCITGFSYGTGSLSEPSNVIDFRAMGAKFADLTISATNPNNNLADGNTWITVTGHGNGTTTGVIELIGVAPASGIISGNFLTN